MSRTFQKKIRNRNILFIDMILVLMAYALMVIVYYPVSDFFGFFIRSVLLGIVTFFVYASSMYMFSIYQTDWLRAGTKDYFRLITAVSIAGVIGIVIGFIWQSSVIYPKMNIAVNILIICSILALRLIIRGIYKIILLSGNSGGKKVLIIGAGRLAVSLIKDIHENSELRYTIVGLIDDDKARRNQLVYGERVLGTRNDIKRICEEQSVEEIIFAIYSLKNSSKVDILNICNETGCKVKVMPGVEEMLSGNITLGGMREVEIEDLLNRDPITLDNKLIEYDIKGKIVMVTGGGGSIGSELCRQIIKYKPKTLIVLDIYENTTYELQNELMDKYPDQEIVILIASVRDEDRLNQIFNKYKPELVFHAAAHKHVPLMEANPVEAIKNNVFGTLNTAKCAKKYGAKSFVLISTDKAVNPTNVMGATKRVCEMIVQAMSKNSNTNFVAVRFGNVLGSNGSVIPRFKNQIANGDSLTVTHKDITRFFMTIPEAAQLVLQAASYAHGGEIFVLDMGEPVKIYDLAEKMIRLSGLKPGEDIKIEVTGLRPGEKLYEEILMSEEGLKNTSHKKIFVGKPIDVDAGQLKEKIELLRNSFDKNCDDIKDIMEKVVPTYTQDINHVEELKSTKEDRVCILQFASV